MAENANSIIQSSFRPHHDVVSGAPGTQPARSNKGDLLMDASVSELNDEDKPSTESAINSDTRAPSGAVLNVSRYKLMSPAKLPISRSSCITIPPGLSPSSLLDSPILISDVKVEPSPTTGSLVKFQRMQEHEGSATLMAAVDSSDDRNIGNSESRHHDRSIFRSGLSSLNPLASAGSHFQQYESFVQVRDWEKPKSFTSLPLIRSEQAAAASSRDLDLSVAAPSTAIDLFNSSTSLSVDIDSSKLHQSKGSDMEVQASELEDKEANLSVTGEKSTEDGYNWRKYGQKHVKGSEFPRSYYKCTYPNCQVKKLLERSQDGKITEIIYKGRHDHPKPQPKRRFAVGNVLSVNEENLENFSSLNSSEDKTSNAHGQTSYRFEPDNIPELRPSTTSDDEHDDDDNNDDNDPELKRRKQEFGNVDLSPLIAPSREPRVVVQTISEVDILDDGYRWRKYGQKVVKGNPNPRSYYKCTNVGCPVRKHVERASHDPRAVITTYEGKHNHDVPAARSSNHETAAPSTYMTSMEAIRLTRLEGSDGISLDLGVGVSSSPEDASYEKQQTTEPGQERSRTQIASSDCDMTNEGTPRNFTNHQYEIRGQQGERFSFQTPPLNFSSNPYPQSMGNILMGP